MPYCTECGSQVKETDKFCTNCGNPLNKIEKSLSREQGQKESPWNNSEIAQVSSVLSWVLETHSTAMVSLTSEIAPFLETAVRINPDDEEYYYPTSVPTEFIDADVVNLLFRSEFVGLPYEYMKTLDRVKKDIEVSVEEMRVIYGKTVELLKAYASTKEALESIVTVFRPIEKKQLDFAILRKTENVTNLDRLMKYESVLGEFMREIRKEDWSRFPQADPIGWKEKALSHRVNFVNEEYEKQLYQYPVLGLFPINMKTDIERRLAPFFLVLDNVDDSYFQCKILFERCKNSSGFLKGPPVELKEETVSALQDFNINYGGLCYPGKYASGSIMRIEKNNRDGIRRIRSHKYSLADVDRLLSTSSPGAQVENAGDIIDQIYYLVRWG